jgi:hypothetical protein
MPIGQFSLIRGNQASALALVVIILLLMTGGMHFLRQWAKGAKYMRAINAHPRDEIVFFLRENLDCTATATALGPCTAASVVPDFTLLNGDVLTGSNFDFVNRNNIVTHRYRLLCAGTGYDIEAVTASSNPVQRWRRIGAVACP